jgi:preprotein translocase subunit SecE
MRLEEGEVADSKRRGEDAADDRLDDEFAEDEYTDDTDGADERTDERRGSRSGTATSVAARKRTDAARRGGRTAERSEPRLGLWGRVRRFILEVVAEMRKVIWPTRKELITYTTVVVVFVTVMLTIVALFDWGFAHVVLWVFGGAKK